MFDPKVIYQDRTPPALIDAPRPPEARPRFAAEEPTWSPMPPKRPKKHAPTQAQRARAWRRTPEYRAWSTEMERALGVNWRRQWVRYKMKTGGRQRDPAHVVAWLRANPKRGRHGRR